MEHNEKITFEQKPIVSVLMSVFNERSEFLEISIQSVLDQTFSNFEFVILDDGSKNKTTISILDYFAQKDTRIRFHKEPHRGLTKTLNVGVSYCKGRYICRQDSDDWSEPDRIEKQVEFMEQHPELGLVGSNVMLHQEKGTLLWRYNLPINSNNILKSFQVMNPFAHGAVCLRKVAVEKTGGYRESFSCSQDYDFFWRLCERYGGANLSEALYHHRRTAGSVSANNCYEQMRVAITVRFLADQRINGIPEDIGQARKEAEMKIPPPNSAIYLFKRGDQMILAGHYGLALRLFLRGIATNPLSLTGYMKFFRLGLFLSIPPMRKKLFGIKAEKKR